MQKPRSVCGVLGICRTRLLPTARAQRHYHLGIGGSNSNRRGAIVESAVHDQGWFGCKAGVTDRGSSLHPLVSHRMRQQNYCEKNATDSAYRHFEGRIIADVSDMSA